MSDNSASRDLLGIAPYGETLKEATSRTFDGAAAFLSRICLPAAEEFGLFLRDKVHRWRMQNLGERLVGAAEMVAATGAEPREVPMRTLTPLLEGASREDDLELAELWTSLLANAAYPSADEVPPIYPTLLSQLSPADAGVLVAVRNLCRKGFPPDAGNDSPPRFGARRGELESELNRAHVAEMDISITILRALGLLETEPVVRMNSAGDAFLSDGAELRLSPLGERFLVACEPPTAHAA
jgi:hypothetical protein